MKVERVQHSKRVGFRGRGSPSDSRGNRSRSHYRARCQRDRFATGERSFSMSPLVFKRTPTARMARPAAKRVGLATLVAKKVQIACVFCRRRSAWQSDAFGIENAAAQLSDSGSFVE